MTKSVFRSNDADNYIEGSKMSKWKVFQLSIFSIVLRIVSPWCIATTASMTMHIAHAYTSQM